MSYERLKNTAVKTASFLLSGALSFGCTPSNSDPTLPPGYSNVDCSQANVLIAKPDNWYFKEERVGNTRACFVTKERIEPDKFFDTGFSLNMTPNAARAFNKKPSEIVDNLIDNPPPSFIAVPKGEANCVTEDKIRSCTREFTIGGGIKDWIFKISGNDRADTIYLMWFEQPIGTSDLQRGRTILGSIKFK